MTSWTVIAQFTIDDLHEAVALHREIRGMLTRRPIVLEKIDVLQDES